jgi:hypothetical protein
MSDAVTVARAVRPARPWRRRAPRVFVTQAAARPAPLVCPWVTRPPGSLVAYRAAVVVARVDGDLGKD